MDCSQRFLFIFFQNFDLVNLRYNNIFINLLQPQPSLSEQLRGMKIVLFISHSFRLINIFEKSPGLINILEKLPLFLLSILKPHNQR